MTTTTLYEKIAAYMKIQFIYCSIYQTYLFFKLDSWKQIWTLDYLWPTIFLTVIQIISLFTTIFIDTLHGKDY